MARRVMVILLLSECLALATFAQEQEFQPPRPSVINSTYRVTIAKEGTTTIHLHEESGQLLEEEKSEKGGESSRSMKYEDVNYIGILHDFYDSDAGKRTLVIGSTIAGPDYWVTLPTQAEAEAVARYIASKASLHLELIGGAWRVRKPFECPEAGQPGCRDFKELLDHDDEDIVRDFYEDNEHTHVYACFSNEERSFFVISFSGFHYHYIKDGFFSRAVFRNGQLDISDLHPIDWFLGDSGEITGRRPGQKPESLGGIDASSLTYKAKFTNRMNTTTQYELSIRWSTGRYSESWSGKNDNGEPFSHDSSGICVKLH